MIKAWGVSVLINGEEVGRKTSEGGNAEWWKGGKGVTLPPQDASMLDKTITPFAPLWYDYHLDVRSK